MTVPNPINSCDFSVIHSNINGAKSHLDEFMDTISQNGNYFSVIGISETRLKKEEERFFSLSRYTPLFTSREAKHPGGGVGLFFRNDITSRSRPDLNLPPVEGLILESVFGECSGVVAGRNMIVGVIYRQPGGNVIAFLDSFEATLNLITREGKSALIMGDLNIDTLVDSVESRRLTDLMTCYNFVNVVQSPTCEGKGPQGLSSTCLDHLWVNFFETRNIRSGVANTYFSDHYCPYLVIPSDSPVSNSKFSYKVRYDLKKIYDDTAELKWDDLYSCESADMAYEHFHKVLWSVVSTHTSTMKKKSNYITGRRDWTTPEFLQLLQKRDAACRSTRANPHDTTLRNKFISLRNKATYERRRLRFQFNDRMVKDGLQKGKSPWEVVNRVLGVNRSKSCCRLNSNGSVVDDKSSIAELFNEYYTSCVTPNEMMEQAYETPPFFPASPHAFSFRAVNAARVQFIIEHLKSTSVSRGQLPVCILKHLAPLIADPLTHVINLSMSTGIFPHLL